MLVRPKSEDPEVVQGVQREMSKLIINFVLPLKTAAEKAGDFGLDAYGHYRLDPGYLADIAVLRYTDSMTSQIAKEVVETMWREWSGRDPIQVLNGLGLLNLIPKTYDEPDMSTLLASVLEEQAAAVADYKNGKQAAMGRLMGASMKKLGRGADPKEVKAELERLLA
jgi:aspartyl-tRNA(Asn)/glutamyl-tRNA(Gln) amidotransferase subunit B